MRREYWFFDVSSGEHEGRESIWLWTLDDNGGVHILIDPSFTNYFYVDADAVDEESIRSELMSALSASIKDIGIEKVVKKLYGKEKTLYRISGSNEYVKDLIQVFRRKYGESKLFEDDIRFTTKYIIFNDLNPSTWYEFEVEPLYERDGVSFELLNEVVEEKLHIGYPPLRVLAVDMVIASKFGAPDAKKDPILFIVAYDGDEVKEFVYNGSDHNILKAFDEFVDMYNPHVIVTFKGNSFIWPYIIDRTKHLSSPLTIGMLGIDIHQSLYGHTSIAGRIHIDFKDYVDDIPILQRKTLEELAGFLGLDVDVPSIDELEYYYYWVNNRKKLLDYIRWRVKVLYEAFNILKDHLFTLSSITGIPPDYVLTASSGRQAEHYIMRKAVGFGEIIPKVLNRRFRSYIGGLVLKPVKGLHENIAVIDYKSMYPTLIMKYNISPETVTKHPGPEITFYDDVSIGVRRDIKGLFPTIVEHLVEERDRVRSAMHSMDKGGVRYRVLDARQRVLKILANTLYGYMGWLGARWYSWEGASLVTYLGRKVIGKSLEKARELGLDVVYGDTDSLFVYYDEDKVNRLISWIGSELGLEAKIDKIYNKLLFTEAKKRYAGLTVDGAIDIVGLEYVRRDWCDYARETQYILIKMVLEGKNRDKIINEFRRRVQRLRRRDVSIDVLVVWEQITRPLEGYKANAPHIAVARKLAASGWRVKRGVFIGYVIVQGEGPLYKRAVHYLEVDPKDIDIDYYIFNQVLPVAKRILEPIGISSKTLESIASSSGFGLDAFTGV